MTEKKMYEAPAVVVLGSVTELTRNNVGSVNEIIGNATRGGVL